MASTVSLEEVKKIISFPVKGEKWGIKNLVGAALTFGNFIVPLIPTIPVLGYAARIMKRIIVDDEDPALPEWNDWTNLFLEGLKVFGVMAIFEVPAMLLIFAGYGMMLIPIFIKVGSYSNPSPDIFNLTMLLSDFGGMVLFMAGLILLLVAMIFLSPALGNMIATGDFGAAFRIKEWWPVFKANFAGYLVAIILLIGLWGVCAYVMELIAFTVILCLLLPFIISFIGFALTMIMMTLFAVAYRDGVRKLAA